MDSDDLGGDLNLSDCGNGQQERVAWKSIKKSKRSVTNTNAGVYRQEFDTNVFEVALFEKTIKLSQGDFLNLHPFLCLG